MPDYQHDIMKQTHSCNEACAKQHTWGWQTKSRVCARCVRSVHAACSARFVLPWQLDAEVLNATILKATAAESNQLLS